MRVLFTPNGWADYHHWLDTDPALFQRLNTLINDIRRSPFRGLGKSEPLKENRTGWWSRRLTDQHRLVYRVTGSGDDQRVEIAQRRGHY